LVDLKSIVEVLFGYVIVCACIYSIIPSELHHNRKHVTFLSNWES